MDISDYLKQIAAKLATGIATEHSHRATLSDYVQSRFNSNDYIIINEAKRIACGQPDLTIYKGKTNHIEIGYIEAKDIGVDLNKEQKSAQCTRYKASLENFILTNHYDFIFFKRGEKVKEISIATLNTDLNTDKKSLTYHHDNFDELKNAIDNFLIYQGQKITDSQKLAAMMAKKAQMMRHVFMQALSTPDDDNHTLAEQFDAFQKILIHDLDYTQFADVYAQTITYGLFTARMYDDTPDDFSRSEAAGLIPRSNPFLRQLFDYIAGTNLDDRVVWIVDSLCDLLKLCVRDDILRAFSFKDGGQDPIIHFYEHFLGEYDKKLKKARGVWYTPQPVVNFIIRAIDDSLKTHFDLPDGIASTEKTNITVDGESREVHRVQLLDVATGTGTFMAQAIQHIYNAKFQHQQNLWNNYVDKHLLPRLHGFELLMASYTMCHFKINLLLDELGYTPKDPKKPKRLSVYLTNSLEEEHPSDNLPFARWLSDEANQASEIKRDMPIMVAFGNPPYRGESENKGDWIMGLMEAYKKEPDRQHKLQERNPKWINDDYVKFLRLAEYYIDKNQQGIVAYINAHGFLDNPTFRGMRWHLLTTFDQIYIIDLHGNTIKKETSPDGSKDENVFDIKQGVSINIFIKTNKKKSKQLARVHHYDCYGVRHDKYQFLNNNDLSSIAFTPLPHIAPMYFMAKKDFTLEAEYNKGFAVNALMPLNSVGITTARDHFTIHQNANDLKTTIKEFLNCSDNESARIQFHLGQDTQEWKVAYARQDLQDNINKIIPEKITYRPFDNRYTYYTGKTKGFHCRTRNEVMQHFVNGNNIGLMVGRQGQVVGSMTWNLIFITKNITDLNVYYRGGEQVFPIYLYPNTENGQKTTEKRIPNLNQEMIKKIEKYLKIPFITDHEDKESGDQSQFTPLDILDYIYAVLHSLSYREKYAEFLKIDFPRVPYPNNAKEFFNLCATGSELRQIHLLEHQCLNTPRYQYIGDGDNEVMKIDYKDGHVYINPNQRFEDVPQIAWDFYIGGYQPAQKWLKDRRGQILDYDDITHYQKIIIALSETHRIMQKIDKIFKP